MLISICIPVHNRLHDLKITMPYLLAAANASPPVEISVLDYRSSDGLMAWFYHMMSGVDLEGGNSLHLSRFSERDYYHKAHSFNLAVLNSAGEYFCLFGADAYPEKGYITAVRSLIEQGAVWGCGKYLCGIIFCQRKEFIDAGGYDERFELYGPEDRELDARLKRRGAQFGLVPNGLMHVIPTSDEDKVKNYRVKMNKHAMSREMRQYLIENEKNKITTANPNGWGEWR